jgi:alpha-L-rhamnosidase
MIFRTSQAAPYRPAFLHAWVSRVPILYCSMILILLSLAYCILIAIAVPGQPDQLRLEYLLNPIGMDVSRPRFSWALQHSDRSEGQTAYRITVYNPDSKQKRLPGTILWDSGKVTAGKSTNIEYEGPGLMSATRYFWNVRVYWSVCAYQ